MFVMNRSLGMDVTVIDGKPMWKERGADTFNPFSSDGYINVDESIFKSKYQSIVRTGTDISATPSGHGFGCSLVKLNMDKIQSIAINTIQVCNTYANTYSVALFDEPPTSYNDVYNNKLGVHTASGSYTNWTKLNTNITIDCQQITGFKYLATAYSTNNSTYQTGMAQITSMTIVFAE